MLLPIFAYGQPVLKRVADEVAADYPELGTLIEDMWQTMYNAKGVGLAAPQIGLSIRLFVVDTLQIDDEDAGKANGIKQVFINAYKIEEFGKPWAYEEGCLSIPDLRGDVERPETIRLRYMNEQFEWKEMTLSGINARVVQHEYDHIDGILFIDKLKPLKKQLIRRRLEAIRLGNVRASYRLKFSKKQ